MHLCLIGDTIQQTFESLLSFAIINQASDIHIDCTQQDIKYLIRVNNGFKNFDYNKGDLLEYIKYQSNLNLMNLNEPQTSVFTYYFSEQEYHLRVASLKTLLIESCVIRILNKSYLDIPLTHQASIQDSFKRVLSLTSGLVCFSGPTGSGKTTSLYNLLRQFNHHRIFTIEDPVEIYLEEIVQTEVNESIGYGYKEGIKQLLRHDPDIIVIGEIRDQDAAQMALRACLTGHLVITTIHAASCAQVIDRLCDLGVNHDMLLDNIALITNQRLKIINDQKVVVYEEG